MAKKTSKKSAGSAASVKKKKQRKKASAKRGGAGKKKVARKSGAKGGSRKVTSKKKAASGSKKKAAAKKPVRKSAKQTAKKTAKKASTPKRPAKKSVKTTAKSAAAPESGAKGAGAQAGQAAGGQQQGGGKPEGKDAKGGGPKGITIVSSKQPRKTRPKAEVKMPKVEPLLKPGGPKWKPLIPSGPKAGAGGESGGESGKGKSSRAKFTKRELEKYRKILLEKRAELIGDISTIESEALLQSSGSLSHLPQHMADHGSDNFEQSISLDLAAVDRNLLRQINDALKRIEDGTYGICEVTGKRISAERLAELPWARYSIEAARMMEQRSHGS